MDVLDSQLTATLLLSLRIAPTFAFAPPFTLMRTPALVRVILSLCLAFWLVLAHPGETYQRAGIDNNLVAVCLCELFLGVTLALALQIAFAALLTAGRVLDFQAGFGLSLIADPTLRTQMPLVGTLLVYAAGALFFATSGPADLLAIWDQSLTLAPLGGYAATGDIAALLAFVASAHLIAFSAVSAVMVGLFLIDMGIAFLSRTLPQMNVLVLGFQGKTLALLALCPLIFAYSGALILRLTRLAIEATPQFL